MNIEKLVIDLSRDPFNPDLNFDVAEEYLRLNQTASAVSFYLRCAEYSSENNLKAYTSLIRMAQCFEDQNGRELSVSNCLLQAVAYDDSRPEAYFKLSQFYERAGAWQESYTWASVGYGWGKLCSEDKLPADIGYYGDYCNKFQMAIAAWWIGRKVESLSMLYELSTMQLDPTYRDAVLYNLERLNASV